MSRRNEALDSRTKHLPCRSTQKNIKRVMARLNQETASASATSSPDPLSFLNDLDDSKPSSLKNLPIPLKTTIPQHVHVRMNIISDEPSWTKAVNTAQSLQRSLAQRNDSTMSTKNQSAFLLESSNKRYTLKNEKEIIILKYM